MAIQVPDIALFGYDENSGLSLTTFGYFHGTVRPQEINYCEEAKARLAEQYKPSILLQGLICAFIEEYQDLELVFQDLKVLRAIDNAVGEQLIQLAEIVGADISGLTTAESRARIRFQVGINVSNGEPETIITYVKELTDSSAVIYSERYPAGISIFVNGPTVPIGLLGLVESVAPAGVGIELISSFGDTLPFAVASEGGLPDPDGLGFGEINLPLEGGTIAERITV